MNTRQMQQQLTLEDLNIHDEVDIQLRIAIEVNEEVRELETKVIDLHDITLDLAHMVDDQAEMVDNIESNINKAVLNTEDGTDRLERIEYMQRTCVIL